MFAFLLHTEMAFHKKKPSVSTSQKKQETLSSKLNESHFTLEFQKFAFFAVKLSCAGRFRGASNCNSAEYFEPEATSGLQPRLVRLNHCLCALCGPSYGVCAKIDSQQNYMCTFRVPICCSRACFISAICCRERSSAPAVLLCASPEAPNSSLWPTNSHAIDVLRTLYRKGM